MELFLKETPSRGDRYCESGVSINVELVEDRCLTVVMDKWR